MSAFVKLDFKEKLKIHSSKLVSDPMPYQILFTMHAELGISNSVLPSISPYSACTMSKRTDISSHVLLHDADMHSAYLLRRRGWVAGWVSVTRRYCIKTAKPILKLFRPSGSAIILVSSDPCADTQFQGNPSAGALNTQVVGKIGDFRATFDGNGAR